MAHFAAGFGHETRNGVVEISFGEAVRDCALSDNINDVVSVRTVHERVSQRRLLLAFTRHHRGANCSKSVRFERDFGYPPTRRRGSAIDGW